MNINDTHIKIDGVAIEDCSTLDVSIEQIDLDSGRNAQGFMQRNVKRFQVYTLTVNYDNRSIQGIKHLYDQIKNKTAVNITFFSPFENAKITKPFYCAGVSSTVKNYDINVQENMDGWLEGTSFEFVQM